MASVTDVSEQIPPSRSSKRLASKTTYHSFIRSGAGRNHDQSPTDGTIPKKRQKQDLVGDAMHADHTVMENTGTDEKKNSERVPEKQSEASTTPAKTQSTSKVKQQDKGKKSKQKAYVKRKTAPSGDSHHNYSIQGNATTKLKCTSGGGQGQVDRTKLSNKSAADNGTESLQKLLIRTLVKEGNMQAQVFQSVAAMLDQTTVSRLSAKKSAWKDEIKKRNNVQMFTESGQTVLVSSSTQSIVEIEHALQKVLAVDPEQDLHRSTAGEDSVILRSTINVSTDYLLDPSYIHNLASADGGRADDGQQMPDDSTMSDDATSQRDLNKVVCACQECDYVGTEAELQAHSKIHTAKEATICKVCFRHFASVHQLNIHTSKRHLGTMHECRLCGKYLTTKSLMVKHKCGNNKKKKPKFITTELKSQTVPLVGPKSEDVPPEGSSAAETAATPPPAPDVSNNRKRRINIKRVGPALYQCAECDYQNTGKLVREHMRRHHSVKKIRCDICAKGFSRKCDFNMHRNGHFDKDGNLRHKFLAGAKSAIPDVTNINEDTFADKRFCEICGFEGSEYTLRIHRRRNHTKMNAKCEICGKPFPRQSALNRHMPVHSKDKKRKPQSTMSTVQVSEAFQSLPNTSEAELLPKEILDIDIDEPASLDLAEDTYTALDSRPIEASIGLILNVEDDVDLDDVSKLKDTNCTDETIFVEKPSSNVEMHGSDDDDAHGDVNDGISAHDFIANVESAQSDQPETEFIITSHDEQPSRHSSKEPVTGLAEENPRRILEALVSGSGERTEQDNAGPGSSESSPHRDNIVVIKSKRKTAEAAEEGEVKDQASLIVTIKAPPSDEEKEVDMSLEFEALVNGISSTETDFSTASVKPSFRKYNRPRNTGKKPANRNKIVVCDICENYTGSQMAIQCHKKRYHPKVVYTCDVCQRAFGIKTECIKHRISHCENTKKKRLLDILANQKKLKEAEEEVIHVKADKLKENMLRSSNATVNKDPKKATHSCPYCEYVGTRVGLWTHKRRYHPKSLVVCGVCGKCFATKHELNIHKSTHMKKKNRNKECSSETFESEDKDQVDPSAQQNETDQMLSAVSADSVNVTDSGEHEASESGETDDATTPPLVSYDIPEQYKSNHQCEICGYESTKSGLAQHKHRHHREKTLQCDICNKTFARRCDFKPHRAGHFDKDGNLRQNLRIKPTADQMEPTTNQASTSQDKFSKFHFCDICGYKSTFFGVKTHKRRDHLERTVQCDICLKKFLDLGTMRKHRKRHFTESGQLKPWMQKVQKSEPEDSSSWGGLECPDCQFEFPSKKALDVHISKAHGTNKNYMCEFCLFRARNKEEVDRHVIRIHREHTFKCDQCQKTYAFETELQNHVSIVHENKQQCKCDICGKEFKALKYLKNHMDRHEKKFRCYCAICKKGFMDKTRLNEHLETHKALEDRSSRFVCRQCGKKFVRKAGLDQHMDSHLGLRKHKCDICGDSFTLIQTLCRHKKRHSANRPYPCTYPGCSKSFVDKTTLDYHTVTHSGESKHKCGACGKVYTQAATLRRHSCKLGVQKLVMEAAAMATSDSQFDYKQENQTSKELVSILQSTFTKPNQQAIIIKPEQLEVLSAVTELGGQTIQIADSGSSEEVMIVVNEVPEAENLEQPHPEESFLCSICNQLYHTWDEIQDHMQGHIDCENQDSLTIVTEESQEHYTVKEELPLTATEALMTDIHNMDMKGEEHTQIQFLS